MARPLVDRRGLSELYTITAPPPSSCVSHQNDNPPPATTRYALLRGLSFAHPSRSRQSLLLDRNFPLGSNVWFCMIATTQRDTHASCHPLFYRARTLVDQHTRPRRVVPIPGCVSRLYEEATPPEAKSHRRAKTARVTCEHVFVFFSFYLYGGAVTERVTKSQQSIRLPVPARARTHRFQTATERYDCAWCLKGAKEKEKQSADHVSRFFYVGDSPWKMTPFYAYRRATLCLKKYSVPTHTRFIFL